MIRVALVETHPIQYKVPWFKSLDESPVVDSTVLYCMLPDSEQQGAGFGVGFQWDIPLLEGYDYRILDNKAREPSVTTFDGCNTPAIGKVLDELHCDVTIVNGWVVRSCLQALRACRKRAIPCIVRGEANNIRPRAAWKSVLHRLLLKQYAACLYIGESNRQFYTQNGVPEDKLFFAPYCVDNDRFRSDSGAAAQRRKTLRDQWQIPCDAFCFLFSGKLVPKKRPSDLLKALRICGEASAGSGNSCITHLLVVGDGTLRPELESYVRLHGLPVTFAGFLNQSCIVDAYVAADCLVLPSDHGETWGLVVNEAMACAKPAIVSDQVGCHQDLVVPGITGWTFPCGDVGALAERMSRMLQDVQAAVGLGTNAAAYVERYCYQTLVAGTLAALKAVVKKEDCEA